MITAIVRRPRPGAAARNPPARYARTASHPHTGRLAHVNVDTPDCADQDAARSDRGAGARGDRGSGPAIGGTSGDRNASEAAGGVSTSRGAGGQPAVARNVLKF